MKTAYINAKVSERYNVPILEGTSPVAAQILKDICIDLCRKNIALSLQVATATLDFTQLPVGGINAPADAEKRLNSIKNGNLVLIDAVECAGCGKFNADSYDNTEVPGIPYSTRTKHSLKGNFV